MTIEKLPDRVDREDRPEPENTLCATIAVAIPQQNTDRVKKKHSERVADNSVVRCGLLKGHLRCVLARAGK